MLDQFLIAFYRDAEAMTLLLGGDRRAAQALAREANDAEFWIQVRCRQLGPYRPGSQAG